MCLQVGKKLNVNIISVTAKLHQMKRLKQLHQEIGLYDAEKAMCIYERTYKLQGWIWNKTFLSVLMKTLHRRRRFILQRKNIFKINRKRVWASCLIGKAYRGFSELCHRTCDIRLHNHRKHSLESMTSELCFQNMKSAM